MTEKLPPTLLETMFRPVVRFHYKYGFFELFPAAMLIALGDCFVVPGAVLFLASITSPFAGDPAKIR